MNSTSASEKSPVLIDDTIEHAGKLHLVD